MKFWEPNASPFAERLESLKHAYNQGFMTSVSCEPMLDGNIKAVIDAVNPYVTDSIWLGTPNQFKARVKWNGYGAEDVMKKVDELLSLFSEERILLLYDQYKDEPKIRWKDEIKKALGMPSVEMEIPLYSSETKEKRKKIKGGKEILT